MALGDADWAIFGEKDSGMGIAGHQPRRLWQLSASRNGQRNCPDRHARQFAPQPPSVRDGWSAPDMAASRRRLNNGRTQPRPCFREAWRRNGKGDPETAAPLPTVRDRNPTSRFNAAGFSGFNAGPRLSTLQPPAQVPTTPAPASTHSCRFRYRRTAGPGGP